uniref:Uncharacterized protein n=1 Tax=Arundo donax TaxID=35708 RepID=A0A0A9F8J4_ARUDO
MFSSKRLIKWLTYLSRSLTPMHQVKLYLQFLTACNRYPKTLYIHSPKQPPKF